MYFMTPWMNSVPYSPGYVPEIRIFGVEVESASPSNFKVFSVFSESRSATTMSPS